jgi:WD40 repeat protein
MRAGGPSGASLEQQRIWAARVWSSGDWGPRIALTGHRLRVSSGVFLSGSVLATGSFDRTVRLWDSSSGAELLRLCEAPAPVEELATDAKGRLLLVRCSDGTIMAYNFSALNQEIEAWLRRATVRVGLGSQ